jgi:hypothetical protein
MTRMQMRLALRASWRNTRNRCDCSGYHFPHRKTGGACCHGPRADYYQALRQGLDRAEAEQLLSADQLARMP